MAALCGHDCGVLPWAFAESTLHLVLVTLEKPRVAVLCGHECGCAVCGHPSIDDAPILDEEFDNYRGAARAARTAGVQPSTFAE